MTGTHFIVFVDVGSNPVLVGNAHAHILGLFVIEVPTNLLVGNIGCRVVEGVQVVDVS